MTYRKSSAEISLLNIKLDVIYHIDDSCGYIQLEEITDTKGEQDLMPIMAQAYFDDVIEQIKKVEGVA